MQGLLDFDDLIRPFCLKLGLFFKLQFSPVFGLMSPTEVGVKYSGGPSTNSGRFFKLGLFSKL